MKIIDLDVFAIWTKVTVRNAECCIHEKLWLDKAIEKYGHKYIVEITADGRNELDILIESD